MPSISSLYFSNSKTPSIFIDFPEYKKMQLLLIFTFFLILEKSKIIGGVLELEKYSELIEGIM